MVCAGAFAVYLTAPSIYSVWLPLSLGFLWLSVPILGVARPPRGLCTLMGVIIASAWLSVAMVAVFGGFLAQTLWLAILTTALVPLAFVRDIKPVLLWLIPVWLVHAAFSLAQWLQDVHRVTGISNNANVGAAFLLLGCVCLLNGHNRAKWLMLPLVVAMPFTGSRWVAVVAAITVLAIFASRRVHWKYIAVGLAMAVLLVLGVGWEDIYDSFNRPNTLQVHLMGDPRPNFSDRGASWLPRGFYDSGIHNVPWRMMHESGILSGLAWIAATAWGLWARPRFDNRWWLFLTVGLLSVMYYHTWIGPLGGFWWLLLPRWKRSIPNITKFAIGTKSRQSPPHPHPKSRNRFNDHQRNNAQ